MLLIFTANYMSGTEVGSEISKLLKEMELSLKGAQSLVR